LVSASNAVLSPCSVNESTNDCKVEAVIPSLLYPE
jgi:hypothetical protein